MAISTVPSGTRSEAADSSVRGILFGFYKVRAVFLLSSLEFPARDSIPASENPQSRVTDAPEAAVN